MFRAMFVKSKIAQRIRFQIPIDAQSAWCKSQIARIYSALVRLKNGRGAHRLTGI
jgi:hypothetical protein